MSKKKFGEKNFYITFVSGAQPTLTPRFLGGFSPTTLAAAPPPRLRKFLDFGIPLENYSYRVLLVSVSESCSQKSLGIPETYDENFVIKKIRKIVFVLA